MKNKNIKIALVAMALTSVMGCEKLKDFGTTNVNPNDITSPTTYALLTSVETGSIDGYARDLTAGTWVQHSSETQYPGEGVYNVISTYYGMGAYSGPLLNLRTIINTSTTTDEIAVARILTSYIYWKLTDNLGDIPYSQAFISKTPAYDKQEDIYKGIIKELKAAKAQFVNNGALRGDIICNNNVPQWIKFTNSIRAMMAIQLTKRYPAATDYAATEFKAAIADGVLTGNTDNIKLVYLGVAGKFPNPFWSNFDGGRDNGESTTIYNMLTGLGDGRQSVIGTSSTPVLYGLKEANINVWIKNNPGWSHMFGPIATATGSPSRLEVSPVYIMTAAQLYLARAEAAARGWTSEDKSAMYAAGVNASFTQNGLAAPAASYFTQTGTVLDGTNDIKKIAEQAWLTSFPDGTAAWNIYRRTGYPALVPAPEPLNGSHTSIPRRYTFNPGGTSSEYSLNPTSLAAAIARLVPATDQPESKIWWDQ